MRLPAISIIVLSVTATACASGAAGAPSASGDGVLDCGADEVVRDAQIRTAGLSEAEVVAAALEGWTSQGATIVRHPNEELWAAEQRGRDLAVAHPEQNGDGTWVVHEVRACGSPEIGPAPIDGTLDCASDAGWGSQGTIDPALPGEPEVEAALAATLRRFQERHGGSIEIVGPAAGSLVVDDREQIVAIATQVNDGSWVVTTVTGCDGYQL